MVSREQAEGLQRDLQLIAANADSGQALMAEIVSRLKEGLAGYDWVGFYMIEKGGHSQETLVLGPFAGADTPHRRIPLNQGICGAAASSASTIVVDDVASDPRYLACSLETKSEIVAPIFIRGKVAGELDIDSHSPSAFGLEDRRLVEYCASLVGRLLEKESS